MTRRTKVLISYLLMAAMVLTMGGFKGCRTARASTVGSAVQAAAASGAAMGVSTTPAATIGTRSALTIALDRSDWSCGTDDCRIELVNTWIEHELSDKLSGYAFTGIAITFQASNVSRALSAVGKDHAQAQLNFVSSNADIYCMGEAEAETVETELNANGEYTVYYQANTYFTFAEYMAVRIADLDDATGNNALTFSDVKVTLYDVTTTEILPSATAKPAGVGTTNAVSVPQETGEDDDFRVGVTYTNAAWTEASYADFDGEQNLQITGEGTYSISYTTVRDGLPGMLWLDTNLCQGTTRQIDVNAVSIVRGEDGTVIDCPLKQPGSLWGHRNSNVSEQYAATILNPYFKYCYFISDEYTNYKEEYLSYGLSEDDTIDQFENLQDIEIQAGDVITITFTVKDNPDLVETEATASPYPTVTPGVSSAPAATVPPVVSIAPDVTASPTVSIAPEVTASPVVSIAPGATVTPNATAEPTPVVSTEPEVTASPVVSITPGATVTPAPSASPSVAPTPEVTAEPTPTAMPEKSKEPYIDSTLWATNGIHAYIFYLMESWDYRNGYDPGKTNADQSSYAYIKAGGSEVDGAVTTVQDVLLTRDGTYTVSINNIDLSDADEFHFLGITLDLSTKLYGSVAVDDASLKIDGVEVASHVGKVATCDYSDYYRFDLYNCYEDDQKRGPLEELAENGELPVPESSIEITFQISGLRDALTDLQNGKYISPETGKAVSNESITQEDIDASVGSYNTATPAPSASPSVAPTPEVTATPAPSASPSIAPTPEVTATPTPAPTLATTTAPEPEETESEDFDVDEEEEDEDDSTIESSKESASETDAAAKGTVLTGSSGRFIVTSKGTKEHTVTYVKAKGSNKTTVTVPNTITIKGVKYKVTAIAPKAFANSKKLKKITIGSNIKTIGKNAFSKCKKLKTVVIKSKKLKSSSIGKNAFKGTSNKLTIKVPKQKLKSYRKFLKAKGNKKVRVKC